MDNIKILPGDKVTVEMSPYEFNSGVCRLKRRLGLVRFDQIRSV